MLEINEKKNENDDLMDKKIMKLHEEKLRIEREIHEMGSVKKRKYYLLDSMSESLALSSSSTQPRLPSSSAQPRLPSSRQVLEIED